MFGKGTTVWYPSGLPEVDYGGQVDAAAAGNYRVVNLLDGSLATVPATSLRVLDKDLLSKYADLASMPALSVSTILLNLGLRYRDDDIYTFVGNVLVAINPYKPLPDRYTLAVLHKYAAASLGQLPPHIFATATAAMQSLRNFGKNQCVVITGESGAGKTESAKYVVQNLVEMSRKESVIQQQLLDANVLLEAFGNARTTKNNNSSRFGFIAAAVCQGKFIEVQFSLDNALQGAHISDYLLERGRLVHQAANEQNFHIFYALLRGLDEPSRKQLGLSAQTQFNYLGQGALAASTSTAAETLGSDAHFQTVKEAFRVLQLDRFFPSVLRVLAAILALGNVAITTGSDDFASVPESPALAKVAELLQVPKPALVDAFKARRVKTSTDSVVTPLTVAQAVESRDSLAKTLYGRLFRWIVRSVNRTMAGTEAVAAYVGVLDIFGFENFAGGLKSNGLDQFCINFANERLQQCFVSLMFKVEQAEYEREGLPWSHIDFGDNQAVVDLISKLLDEETNFPKGTDHSLVAKFRSKHEQNPAFPRLAAKKQAETSFCVLHFPGEVIYNADGFLARNRDTVRPELLQLLALSEATFVSDQLAGDPEASVAPADPRRPLSPGPTLRTVCATFQQSLNELLGRLAECNCYFVRCVKPNATKEAGKLDVPIVVEQLRYLGILETVRLRQKGFALRLTFREFIVRYKCLQPSVSMAPADARASIQVLLAIAGPAESDIRLGSTRIFVRAPAEALLERARVDRMSDYTALLKRSIHVWLARRRFKRALDMQRGTVLTIQKTVRMFLAKRSMQAVKDAFALVQKRRAFPLAITSQERRRQYDQLDRDKKGFVTVDDLIRALRDAGLRESDGRLGGLIEALQRGNSHRLDYNSFSEVMAESLLLERAFSNSLVIPAFGDFSRRVQEAFAIAATDKDGDVARYIPQLAEVNPDQFAVTVCTIDGQLCSLGDALVPFCVQSCSKPISYAIAEELLGMERVHRHVGREPSGLNFNELALDHNNLPHNPLINSGAIMTCALIKPSKPLSERFDYAMGFWSRLAGRQPIGFANAVYLSERETANRNFCLAYMMKESGAFPPEADIKQTLDLYFMFCSIEVTCEQLAVVAATLANGGICPTTGERVFNRSTVRNCLSLMASCGMYDFSGEFAFTMGFPSKSGVAGALMIVIPNVCGICTWSPRLDALGNSVRGIAFCRELVKTFAFHVFDRVDSSAKENKIDPTRQQAPSLEEDTIMIGYAAASGDIELIRRLIARGANLNHVDYDKRSAAHIAATNGNVACLTLLVEAGINLALVDRFGHTARDDARLYKHEAAVAFLASVESPSPAATSPPKHRWLRSLCTQPTQTTVSVEEVLVVLARSGIQRTDERIKAVFKGVPTTLSEADLVALVERSPLVRRALEGTVAIPNFPWLCNEMAKIHAALREPEHSRIDRGQPSNGASNEPWGVAWCSVDGQQGSAGQASEVFCVQSISKIVSYAMVLETQGFDKTHSYVGREPGGRSYNELLLNQKNQPHNPLINSGAIMIAALLRPDLAPAERFGYVMDVWTRLCGGARPGFSNANYLLRKESADRHYAFAYMMQERHSFPPGTDIEQALSLYFMTCSIQLTPAALAVVTAAFANGGVCPSTGERIFSASTIRACLSLMSSCGMYNYSGEWAFTIGVPAKSGSSGAIMMVIPNVMGICTFSPALDKYNNSIRGLEFAQRLVNRFSFHTYDIITGAGKLDPRLYLGENRVRLLTNLCYAASIGDCYEIQRIVAQGIDVNSGDYDLRTALHVAAAEGQMAAVRLLLEQGADATLKDRFGNTAVDDARRTRRNDLILLLSAWADKRQAAATAAAPAGQR